VRFVFKTRYEQDIRLWRHGGDLFWYGLLLVAMILAPLMLDNFYLGELSAVLVWAVAAIGLMLLVGFTGLVSLGHAAFLGIGAYTNAYLLGQGVPFLISFPTGGIVAALAGVAIGAPTLRMTGLYLAIATLAFAIIVEKIFANWGSVTGGFDGLPVEYPNLFGYELTESWHFYYLCLFVLILVIWFSSNLLRSPTGRAMVAIRDSEISAQSMGVNLAKYKTMAFAISAGITGLAGGLFSHYVQHLAPDSFGILLSIQLLMAVVVGGVGSIHGAIFGAIFIGALPQTIAIMRDYLPTRVADMPGLEPGIFGVILVYVILAEPTGIYGRWLKIRHFFELFPLYKKSTFKRQKSFTKSERLR
jgi:branched-chain amino acid transport system permease protein